MMQLSECAAAVGGQLWGEDVAIHGITTDSRNIGRDDLFVALRGEHFDGHAFVQDALRQGAAAAMVSRRIEARPTVQVEDTLTSLGKLASYWREKFMSPVIGVTGSNGKTTVKEMIAAVLRAHLGDVAVRDSAEDRVLATVGNLNNHIGVPLTLLRLREHHRYAVVEMGMNHTGEIAYLTAMARPDVALINNAQAAHVGELGSVEAIARAKGEIWSGLKANGTAIVNADDPHAALWRDLIGERAMLDFGLSAGSVTGRWTAQPAGSQVQVQTPSGSFDVQLQVPGEHNVRNALAATAVGLALHVPLAAIAAGLNGFTGVKGRLQRKSGLAGALVIDDSYNANPDSMRAALQVLATYPGRRIMVMGDMGELGAQAATLHAEIGETARRLEIDALYTVGEHSAQAQQRFAGAGGHYVSAEELLPILQPQLDGQTTVLVKASRYMRLERVVAGLLTPSKE